MNSYKFYEYDIWKPNTTFLIQSNQIKFIYLMKCINNLMKCINNLVQE